VFAKLPAGGELVLLDGTYTPSTTGVIHWDTSTYTSKSAQIPSGTASSSTYVHALNPGKAVINGRLFVGRSTRKDSYITVRGVRFEGGAQLYNTSYVTLKENGFHGSLAIGTNDHDNGNTYDLVEDSWVWASGERIIAINYRSHNNVWRRVVVRGDGCGTSDCTGDGNPNVGFTVYDSHDVSVQNVIVLDRVLLPTDSGYSDFAIASHTGQISSTVDYRFGRNEWLGTISLNAPDSGYYMEPDIGTTVGDSVTNPTVRISNAVAWNSTNSGFNFARSGFFKLENLVSYVQNDDAVRVAPELGDTGNGGSLTNVVVLGKGRFGLNSAFPASYVNANGSFSQGVYNQTTPTNVVSGDPLVGGALQYVTRIESTSTAPRLSGTGSGGANIGATVLNRYGTDGTRYGQSGYNALTSKPATPCGHGRTRLASSPRCAPTPPAASARPASASMAPTPSPSPLTCGKSPASPPSTTRTSKKSLSSKKGAPRGAFFIAPASCRGTRRITRRLRCPRDRGWCHVAASSPIDAARSGLPCSRPNTRGPSRGDHRS